MLRRMWIWTLVVAVASVGGSLPACKRQGKAGPGTNAPSVARPVRMPGPSTQELARETREQLQATFFLLDPLPFEGIAYQTPDGESWSRYPSGLMIHELRPSFDGVPPRLGQTVSVAYSGMYPDTGKVFDRRPAGDPLIFRMGSKDLVKGFSLGMQGMHPGGKRRVYLPAALAYGDRGKPAGQIPPGQDLIFEIELLSVTGDAIDIAEELPKFEPLGPPAPATKPQ